MSQVIAGVPVSWAILTTRLIPDQERSRPMGRTLIIISQKSKRERYIMMHRKLIIFDLWDQNLNAPMDGTAGKGPPNSQAIALGSEMKQTRLFLAK